MNEKPPKLTNAEDFASKASETLDSFLAEFMHFLATNKKWWLTPILLVLGLVGLLVILSASGAAPFIYTLF